MSIVIDFSNNILIRYLDFMYILVDRLHGSQKDLPSTPLDIRVESMPLAPIIVLWWWRHRERPFKKMDNRRDTWNHTAKSWKRLGFLALFRGFEWI
jgi:hypothetical protein